MSSNLIDGVFILGSNAFAIKYFAYSDDVTLLLSGTCSVSKAFDLLLDVLKQFKWRLDFIDILNIPFGSKQKISRVFSAEISSVKNEVLRLKKIHSTFDAKFVPVIVKIKILPLLSFFSQVL